MSEPTRQRVLPLRAVSEFIRDGTHASFQRVSRGVPLLSAKNITEAGEVAWDASVPLISEADFIAVSRSFQAACGDILLTIVGSIGRVAIFRGEAKVAFQRSVAVIRPRPDLVDRRFLAHVLRAPGMQAQLARRANATAQAGVYLGELAHLQVPVPPLSRQREASEILDAVDEQISSAQRLIVKLNRAAHGFRQDIFTGGPGRGQSVTPRSSAAAGALYPGVAPAGWSLRTLKEVSRYVTYGFTNPMPTAGEGPWLLTAADIGYGRIDLTRARHTTAAAFERRLTAKSRPQPGDILITKDGTLGRAAKLDMAGVCVNQSVAVVRLTESSWADYVTEYLLSPGGQASMLGGSSGSAISHLYVTKLAGLLIPFPPEEEAAQIVAGIRRWQALLAAETHRLAKLRRLKQGLMADLLDSYLPAPSPTWRS